jgi:hypothetical protein
MYYLLLFHCDNGCKKVPVLRYTYIARLVNCGFTMRNTAVKENPNLVDSVHVVDLLLKWSLEISLEVIIVYCSSVHLQIMALCLHMLFERFNCRVPTIYDNQTQPGTAITSVVTLTASSLSYPIITTRQRNVLIQRAVSTRKRIA